MAQESSNQALDRAFESLARYSQGDAVERLAPIERAMQTVGNNPTARAALERRLAAHLGPSSSQVARAFVCRQLAVIGSAASVPALTPLLADEHASHMARYALERIPGPEADTALRDAIGRTAGTIKVGVINSVGVRRDQQSVPLLTKLAADDNVEVAAASAKALGEIGTPDASSVLEALQGKAMVGPLRLAVADASLICAERLVAAGDRERALRLLERITVPPDAPHIGVAVNRARSSAMRR